MEMLQDYWHPVALWEQLSLKGMEAITHLMMKILRLKNMQWTSQRLIL